MPDVSRSVATAVVATLMMTLGVQHASGQATSDTLSYELIEASVSTEPARKGWIIVEFGPSLPKRYLDAGGQLLTVGGEWAIEVIDRHQPASPTTVDVSSVFVPRDPAQNRLVVLKPGTPIDPATQFIRIRLLIGNFPEVVIGEVKKAGAAAVFGPAKGKEDADLYFKGIVLAGPGSGPTYTVDAKAGYLWALPRRAGALGAKMTYVVDKASDIGPDSITVKGSYAKVVVVAPASGVILNVDPIGLEFDSDNDTRNVTSAASGTVVLPPIRLAATSHAAADFVLGYEAGQNHSNAVTNASFGRFWRTVVGANGHLLFQGAPLLRRLELAASWKVRLLTREEPFMPSGSDQAQTLTDEPRHIVMLTAALMVNKALGFSIGYRHGSEPPQYQHVRHRTEIGLVLKLAQVKKG